MTRANHQKVSSYTAGDPRLDNFEKKYQQIMSGQNTLNLGIKIIIILFLIL